MKPTRAAGNELEDAVQEAIACPQDADERELLAVDGRRVHRLKRRFDALRGHRQFARHLIGKEEADFAEKLPEAPRIRVFFPHQCQLVLHKRMRYDGEMVRHGDSPSCDVYKGLLLLRTLRMHCTQL
jgi:hypothetical protein